MINAGCVFPIGFKDILLGHLDNEDWPSPDRERVIKNLRQRIEEYSEARDNTKAVGYRSTNVMDYLFATEGIDVLSATSIEER